MIDQREPRSFMVDLTRHDWRGYIWLTVLIGINRWAQRGHQWMYRGIVRRDCWKLWWFTVIVIKMPEELPSESADLERRAAARATV